MKLAFEKYFLGRARYGYVSLPGDGPGRDGIRAVILGWSPGLYVQGQRRWRRAGRVRGHR
jgi:hypothetical protein